MEPITHPLRTNMRGSAVADLQAALEQLDSPVPDQELSQRRYGRGTAQAVSKLQSRYGLQPTGRVDAETAEAINKELGGMGLLQEPTKLAGVEVTGRVTDKLGEPLRAVVSVLHVQFRKEATLAEVETNDSGRYRVVLEPDNLPETLNLKVRAKTDDGELESPVVFKAEGFQELDLTLATEKVVAKTAFETVIDAVKPVLGGIRLSELRETDTSNDITFLARDRDLEAETMARVALAHKLEGMTKLPAATFFAFLDQRQPASLPGRLVGATATDEEVEEIAERALADIISLDPGMQRRVLNTSAKNGTVPLRVAAEAEKTINAFQGLRADVFARDRFGAGKATLIDMLDTTALTDRQRKRFIDLQIEAQTKDEEIWALVEKDTAISAKAARDLRASMTLGGFSKNHVPFISYAKKSLDEELLTTPGRLAGFGRADWEKLIRKARDEGVEIVPDSIDGENDDDRIANFAEQLRDRAESNFPTMAVMTTAARSDKVKFKAQAEVVDLVNTVPDMNLRILNLTSIKLGRKPDLEDDEYAPTLRATVAAVQNLSDEAITDLKRAQRAMRLAPHADAATVLLAESLDSSHRIHELGRGNFVRRATEAGVTEFRARQIYDRAEAAYGYLVAKFLEYRMDLDKFSPDAVGGAWLTSDLVPEIEAEPSLATLFGTLDACACDWCESVHSPAAYFTDVLRWLKQRDARGGFPNALRVLLDRRPDLATIKLSCANTDTVMPYIDLVNEVLEEVVNPTGQARQTSWDSPELMAEPEHVNEGAYATLANAGTVFAPGLPFDLRDVESHIYLAHLGLTKATVMAAFQDLSTIPPDPTHPQIAAAYFLLAPGNAQIITQPNPAAQSDFWAYNVPGELVPQAPARVLMARADITYEDLAELLQMRFIIDEGPAPVFVPEFECDLFERQVINLTPVRLDRMNRFIRLWKQLGWEMWELDLAIMADNVGESVLGPGSLARLHQLDLLREALSLSFEEAISLVEDMNIRRRDWLTGDGKSLYTDLFQNRAVLNPPDPAFDIAAVTAAAPAVTLGARSEVIAAVLALGAEDMARLMPLVPDPEIALPAAGDPLSLENLSKLHRFRIAAKALGLTISDMLTLVRLSGGPTGADGRIDPFLTLQSIADFVKANGRVMATGLSVGETRHLLTHWPESPHGTSEDQIEGHVGAIQTTLFDLRSGTDVPEEDRADALERQLAAVPGFEDASLRATAISIIDDTFAGTLAERNTFITAHFEPLMSVATAIAAFAPFAGPPAGFEAAVSARRLHALDAIYGALARTSLIAMLASQFGIEDALASELLWEVSPGAGQPTLGERFVAPTFIERTPDNAEFVLEATRADNPEIFDGMSMVAKLDMATTALDLSTERSLWVLRNAGSFGLPDLTALPREAGDAPVALSDWLVFPAWVSAMRTFPETPDISLRQILSQVGTPGYDQGDMIDDLAVWSGREPDTILQLVTGFSLAYPVDFTVVGSFERLLSALEVQRLAGVGADRLFAWAQPGASVPVAHEIKMAAKARHPVDQWLEIAAPLQDVIREAKRTALVTYLTSRPPAEGQSWRNSDALFAHFLIDTEMSSCRKTSRLVTASGSVQIFVQRCLMNLEEDVLADAEADEDWLHWDWMQNYRVWEAARKIFLYPENVIRPELNTMKSPLFVALEQKLGQAEINEENTEDALMGYLEGLDEISNLEVQCMHTQNRPDSRVIHVLARSRAEPSTYHYRTRVFPHDAAAAYWTPWQQVDIEFSGTPVFGYHNRRLHLFWLTMMEKPDPTEELPDASEYDGVLDAKMMWEIQLNWSVLKRGTWSPAVKGRKKLIYPSFRPRRSFHLKTASVMRDGKPHLAVNIYVSTTPEFNDRPLRLWDSSSGSVQSVNQDEFGFSHSETQRPEHMGLFLFNRDVRDVRLRNAGGIWDRVSSDYGAEGAEVLRLSFIFADLRLPVGMKFIDQHLGNTNDNDTDLNVVKSTTRRLDDAELLEGADAPFQLVVPSQTAQFDSRNPFFYKDPGRSFFVRPTTEWRVDHSFTTEAPSNSGSAQFRVRYTFDHFYHPYTQFFLDQTALGGLKQFYKRSTQLTPPNTLDFNADYDPRPLVVPDHNTDIVDFGFSAAYSGYNWEAFFHVPFLLATRLAENQRFEEAIRFLRFIFDPTNSSSDPAPARYWITKPFFRMTDADYKTQKIERLLELVNGGSATHIAQVEQWRDDPADPHLIARLRPVAYQRAVVMAYIDTLLDWADQEFRRFSSESLNVATQLYVRAKELLGTRPEAVPVDRRLEARSFAELEDDLDAFGNALVEVENLLPPGAPGGGGSEPLPPITLFYFCIPGNAKLLDYWDRVERNLWNLRHCRDIEGIERSLPLFSPPIDPAMLVAAAAGGMDLTSLAGGSGVALPHYRFRFMIQRAYDFAAEVEKLGSSMLQALERRDEAELARLRENHEIAIRELMKTAAEHRITEAEEALEALKKAKDGADYRVEYYKKKSETFTEVAETIGITLKAVGFALKLASVITKLVAGGIKAVPGFQAGIAGIGGSPVATLNYGGHTVGETASKVADSLDLGSQIADKGADLSFKIGYFLERQAKYKNEMKISEWDKKEIEKRILAAEARIEGAKADLAVEERHIEHGEEVAMFLKSRFTDKELYDWMVSQLSTVYFQGYQTAYNMALAAAACAEREVGLKATDHINFGYWDSLHKGLLSGEKLSQDLRRLEAAYIEKNRRQHEIKKDISLRYLDAEALLELRSAGACEFELPEMLFDADHPGQYKRRIKSVAITIPSVAGPYTSVNARLTMLHDSTRLTPQIGTGYARDLENNDLRFADNWAALSTIVTSDGQEDDGMFELRLEDERYLPFEGAGAISRWRLELPPDTNAFDLDSVTDAIIHVRYTAVDGGEPLATAARALASQAPVSNSVLLMRLDQAFPDAYAALVNPPPDGQDQALDFTLTRERLPYLHRQRTIAVTRVDLTAIGATVDLDGRVTGPGNITETFDMGAVPDLGGRRSGGTGAPFAAGVPLGDWQVQLRRDGAADFRSLAPGDLDGLYVAIHYSATA